MVKKVIMNLGLSKAPGPDCIPVVALKNCEPKLSYILAELLNNCRKESCFPDCWKVSSVVPVFRNVGERSTPKTYLCVVLLSVISKVFENLVNNEPQIFSQMYLKELLGLLTCLGLLELWHSIYPRLLTEFGMLSFFTNVSLMEFQVRYLACFFFSQKYTASSGSRWKVFTRISS